MVDDTEMGRSRHPRGRRPRKPPKRRMQGVPLPENKAAWSTPVRLGDHIEIRAKTPVRAAFMELQPGLYVVGELRVDALEIGATAAVVTKEILHAVDKGLDKVLPSRKAKKAPSSSTDRHRTSDLDRRERDLRRRERDLHQREQALQRAQASLMSQLQVQAQTPARPALPAPRRRPPIQREAAPWVVDDDQPQGEVSGDTAPARPVKLEEPNTLEYLMWRQRQYEE